MYDVGHIVRDRPSPERAGVAYLQPLSLREIVWSMRPQIFGIVRDRATQS